MPSLGRRRRRLCPFDVLIVTAPTERSAQAYQEELVARLPKLYYVQQHHADTHTHTHHDEQELLVLAVADPKGKRVGSGGGTLNALDHVRHYLQEDHTHTHTHTHKPLSAVSILMIHSGGDSQRSPTNSVCGKAWSCLNSQREEDGGSQTPIELLLEQFCVLFERGVPRGSLVVASSDVLLILPRTSVSCIDWHAQPGVVGLATLAPAELGPSHGVYVTADTHSQKESNSSSNSIHPLTRYLQKASLPELEAEGAICPQTNQVQIDTGVIFMSPAVTAVLEKLLLLHADVFGRCTTRGLLPTQTTTHTHTHTEEKETLRLELYSDILCALAHGLGKTEEEYMRMDGTSSPLLQEARRVLWLSLNPWPFAALTPEGALFGHLGTTQELLEMMTLKMPAFSAAFRLGSRVCCRVEGEGGGGWVGVGVNMKDEGAVVLNSILRLTEGREGKSSSCRFSLGKDAVVEHCYLQGSRLEVGPGALVSGLCFAGKDVWVLGEVCVQEVRLEKVGEEGQTMKNVAGWLPLAASASTFSSSSCMSTGDEHKQQQQQPYVVSVLSINDPIKATYVEEEDVSASASASASACARVWGLPWARILEILGVGPERIWPSDTDTHTHTHTHTKSRTLWNARLFPVVEESVGVGVCVGVSVKDSWRWMQALAGSGGAVLPSPEEVAAWREAPCRLSLCDILAQAEPRVEFRWRRAVEEWVLASSQDGEGEGGKTHTHIHIHTQSEKREQVLAVLRKALGGWGEGASVDHDNGEEKESVCVSLDEVWKGGLPLREDREWLVEQLEEWVESDVLAAPPTTTMSTARRNNVLASTFALLSRLLRDLAGKGEEDDEEEPAQYDGRWVEAMGKLEGGEEERREAFRAMRAVRREWTKGVSSGAIGSKTPTTTSSNNNNNNNNHTKNDKDTTPTDTLSPTPLHHLTTAAAHYEKTTFHLVKQQVASVHASVLFHPVPRALIGTSVLAEAPARIDLSGGWSDTPPISYELGGEVTNIAIKLNGQCPIGARVSVLKERVIRLRARQANGVVTERVCRRVVDLQDHPMEAGGCPTALVRCCLLYCGVLPLLADSNNNNNTNNSSATGSSSKHKVNNKSLNEDAMMMEVVAKDTQEQSKPPSSSTTTTTTTTTSCCLKTLLEEHVGGGLQIETWSELPTGSGLGTSSILVGTVLAALGRACGREYTLQALNHAVLEVEQLMSVGGGWQDQAGGLIAGAKRVFSHAGLPLHVDYEMITLSPATCSMWERHLLLVFTGRQRLARHLVRSVLRRYYAQSPQVLSTIEGLVGGARAAEVALKNGDLAGLGRCLTAYWKQKKVMAPSCEPPHIQRLMKALQPLSLGMSLCGAGGGGFLVLVTKAPHAAERVQEVLEQQPEDHGDAYVATVQLAVEEGLRVEVVVEEMVGGA